MDCCQPDLFAAQAAISLRMLIVSNTYHAMCVLQPALTLGSRHQMTSFSLLRFRVTERLWSRCKWGMSHSACQPDSPRPSPCLPTSPTTQSSNTSSPSTSIAPPPKLPNAIPRCRLRYRVPIWRDRRTPVRTQSMAPSRGRINPTDEHDQSTRIKTTQESSGLSRTHPRKIWTLLERSGQIQTISDCRNNAHPVQHSKSATRAPEPPEFPAKRQNSLRRRRPRLHDVHRVALALGGGDVVPLGWVEGIRVVEVGSDELDVAFVSHALPEPDGFGREAAV